MAQTAWPFENIDTSETQFSLWARNIGEGVVNDKGQELEPFGDSSGMVVKVRSGQALVRGHYYENTAEESLTIAAADLSNPRIDRVVLRLDPTANTCLLTVIQGTPASSPTAPALTQTESGIYDLLLANVTVPAAAVAISPANVSDQRLIFTPWSAATQAGINAAIALKANLASPTFTGTVTLPSTTSVGNVSSTELGFLDGVTSAIQTQLNARVNTVNGAVTTAATGSTVVRNITLSTSDPSGGSDGQVWLKYT
jgi:hypothetical protein